MKLLQQTINYITRCQDDMIFIDLLLKNINKLNSIDEEFNNEIHMKIVRHCDGLRGKIPQDRVRKMIEEMRETRINWDIIDDIAESYDSTEFNMDPKVCKIKNKINLITYKKHNVKYVVNDLISIRNINQSFMIENKICIHEYLNNLRMIIWSEGKFPTSNIKRFTKTIRNFIDENMFPIYKVLFPSSVTMVLGKTLKSIMADGHNYCMIQKHQYKVRSYDLQNLSILLKNAELMLEFHGDLLVKHVKDSNLIFDNLKEMYENILPDLPTDIHSCIFEFTSLSILKNQKEINQATSNELPILNNICKLLKLF